MWDKKESTKKYLTTPLITPLLAILIMVIYVSYSLFHGMVQGNAFFEILENVSFEVFILCEIGFLSLLVYNKFLLSAFLKKHRNISSGAALDELMPLVRSNMYSALLSMIFLALGALSAAMCVKNSFAETSSYIGVLTTFAVLAVAWYNPVEIQIKNLKCTNTALEDEYSKIMTSWTHDTFPSF